MKISINCATDEYMLSKVIGEKETIIDEWSSEYDGEPSTSWDTIFDNVVDEFERYCDDEASSYGEDRTLKEKFDAGVLSEADMLSEFYDFIRFIDISDYDYDITASTKANGKAVTAAIKMDDLQWYVNWLNDYYNLTDDESRKFAIYSAYGKVKLVKLVNSSGGITNISPSLSKPALHDVLYTIQNVLTKTQ